MSKKVFVSGCYDMLHSGHVAFFDKETIDRYRNDICGWKISGAGGGGYLIMITDHDVDNTLQVTPCAD